MENIDKLFQSNYDCQVELHGNIEDAMSQKVFNKVISNLLKSEKDILINFIMAKIRDCSIKSTRLNSYNNHEGGVIFGKLEMCNELLDVLIEKEL